MAFLFFIFRTFTHPGANEHDDHVNETLHKTIVRMHSLQWPCGQDTEPREREKHYFLVEQTMLSVLDGHVVSGIYIN